MYYAGECRNRAELLRVEGDFRELVAPPPWWWFGFDGKALLEAVVGAVVGLIAFQLDPSTGNWRKLLRLLSLLNSPEMAELYRQRMA